MESLGKGTVSLKASVLLPSGMVYDHKTKARGKLFGSFSFFLP